MSILRYKNEQDEWVELPFLRGPQGPSGVDGKDGQNGIDGTNGKDGKDGVSVVGTAINALGELEVTYSTGDTVNLGKVVGTDGTNGKDGVNGADGDDGVGIAKTEIDAEGRLVVTYTDGTSKTLSKVVGADGKDGANGANGKDGADGIGISATTINANGELIITYTTGESSTLGKVVGADGKTPVKGTDYWTEADKAEMIREVSSSMVYVEPQQIHFTIAKSCVLSATGKFGTSSDHYRTDYIDLTGYDTIEFYGKCADTKYSLAFYDSSKAIMTDVCVVGAGSTLTTHTMAIPSGAAYAIGSAYVGSTGADATKYYVGVSSSTSNPVAESISKMKKSLYSFDGKKVMFFGDSITYDESMYVTNLLNSTGMVRVANFAINGATLNNYSDTEMNGSPAQDAEHNNTVPNQVQKLLNNVSSYDVPDIVIVSAGTNGGTTDADYEESQYASEDGTYIELDAVSLTKFSGAIRWIYEKLISCYPNAKIFFATPIQSYGGGSRTFAILSAKAECIRQNCERLSTPCIDAFRKSGIYGRYEVQSANGKYLKDGLHPNADGAVVLAKCYHRELANALID